MSNHSTLSPSSRHRWMTCPGSVREALKYPSTESPAAIDGTHTHTLLDRCLAGGLADPLALVGVTLEDQDGQFVVDADRAHRVKVAIDYISKAIDKFDGFYAVAGEERVDPARFVGRDDMAGTLDVSIVGGRMLEIIDYKDGMHLVSAENNPQLEIYALGKIAGYGLPINGEYPFDTVRMTIIQPKLAVKGMNPISSHTVDLRALIMKVTGELVVQGAACDAPDAPLVPGEAQCRYCPAKGGCAAYTQHTLAQSGLSFAPVGVNPLDLVEQASEINPNELSNERIVQILEAAPLLRQMVETVDEEALKRLKAGVDFGGKLKLVNGRGSRKWSLSEGEIAERLKSMGMPKDAIWQTSLISPAQVEKAVWKNRKEETKHLTKRQIETIEKEYVAHMTGKLTVALASDDRPAVITDASAMFGKLETPAPVAALPDWMTLPDWMK